MKALLSKYEKDVPETPLGKKFSAIYDMDKVIPPPEYLELCESFRRELAEAGLDYSLL